LLKGTALLTEQPYNHSSTYNVNLQLREFVLSTDFIYHTY